MTKDEKIEAIEETHTFHRGSDPETATDIVQFSDDPWAIESYGEDVYAILISDIPEVPQWAKDYAAKYCRDIFTDAELMEIDPENIVSDAGIWDCQEFVSEFWQDNEDKMMAMEIAGFKTNDGAVIFPGPCSKIIKIED